mmetsp:Transcript_27141/g.75675  ORF Transcript_27141/g.75675 Transcript_27141/m.75675 type:complete len:307 (-) Transcript_27141:549-1469(-)
MVPAANWFGAHAGHVGPRLTVVHVELGAHCQLQWLAAVCLSQESLEVLPALLATVNLRDPVGIYAENLLSGLMEGRQPRAVPEVSKAATQVQANGGLAGKVASGAEARLVDALVARQLAVRAIPELRAGPVVQGLLLALLPRLYQSQTRRHSVVLRLVTDVLRLAAHLGDAAILSAECGSSRTAVATQRRERLRGAAPRPPLLEPVRLRQVGFEGNNAGLNGATAATTVPLLDKDALEHDHRVVSEVRVGELSLLAPQRYVHARRRLVGHRDVALQQLPPVLGHDRRKRPELRHDPAKIDAAGSRL